MRAINQYTQGWIHYHGIGQMKHFIQETAGWFNRRLRQLCWSRWKRVKTRYQMLRKYALPHEIAIQYANSRKGYWRLSKPYQMSLALPTKRLIVWGLKDINHIYEFVHTKYSIVELPYTRTVRTVVGEVD
ncbi:group II intron maturase-specific domain-containing protein [Suicoccus acidiformans]|uniref:group II intron maturase-specific domain-containing protein n=1 Tax=Suicoccus acidiformans TaxID=2036206 RepID=UPI003B8386E6